MTERTAIKEILVVIEGHGPSAYMVPAAREELAAMEAELVIAAGARDHCEREWKRAEDELAECHRLLETAEVLGYEGEDNPTLAVLVEQVIKQRDAGWSSHKVSVDANNAYLRRITEQDSELAESSTEAQCQLEACLELRSAVGLPEGAENSDVRAAIEAMRAELTELRKAREPSPDVKGLLERIDEEFSRTWTHDATGDAIRISALHARLREARAALVKLDANLESRSDSLKIAHDSIARANAEVARLRAELEAAVNGRHEAIAEMQRRGKELDLRTPPADTDGEPDWHPALDELIATHKQGEEPSDDEQHWSADSVAQLVIPAIREIWRARKPKQAPASRSNDPIHKLHAVSGYCYQCGCEPCLVTDDPKQALAPQVEPMNGAAMIVAERTRQITQEKFGSLHDDEHDEGQLVSAAECYIDIAKSLGYPTRTPPTQWPWDFKWWKPKANHAGHIDSVRNLVVAGALIAAEIDRLLRIQAKLQPPAESPQGDGPGPAESQERRVEKAIEEFYADPPESPPAAYRALDRFQESFDGDGEWRGRHELTASMTKINNVFAEFRDRIDALTARPKIELPLCELWGMIEVQPSFSVEATALRDAFRELIGSVKQISVTP